MNLIIAKIGEPILTVFQLRGGAVLFSQCDARW